MFLQAGSWFGSPLDRFYPQAAFTFIRMWVISVCSIPVTGINQEGFSSRGFPKIFTKVILPFHQQALRKFNSAISTQRFLKAMDMTAYQKIEGKDVERYLPLLNPVIPGASLSGDAVQLMRAKASFYKETQILEVIDRQAHPPRHFSVLTNGKLSRVVDYRPETIGQMNELFSLTLNDQTVNDYVRFYLRYTQGPNGRFVLLEGVEDIPWKEDPPPAARNALAEMIKSLPQAMTATGDGWSGEISVIFQGAFFFAQLDVSKTGRISLTNQRLMIDQMPVFDDSIAD